MTVAYDAFSSSATSTGTISLTHTPVGTPRAVIVFATENQSSSDEIVSATYGGVAMTEVANTPLISLNGQDVAMYCFFLGTGIPTGAKTVTVLATTGTTKIVGVITLTGAKDTSVVDMDKTIDSASLENPSCTLQAGGKSVFCCISLSSGENDPTKITPLASWTSRVETDYGATMSGIYTYDTIGTADVTAGWTQLANDAFAIALAVSEQSASIRKMMTMGVN